MLGYKGFHKGLRCMGYQYKMGLNVTEKAKAVNYGFHYAEDPLDCLTYYPDMASSEYYVVDGAGDIDEDGTDSKIACTELTILKKLSKEDFVLHALAYMADHPKRKRNAKVCKGKGIAGGFGFVIVCGDDPVAKGKKGDILAFAKEDDAGNITEVAMVTVDGKKVKAGTWYSIDLSERVVEDA